MDLEVRSHSTPWRQNLSHQKKSTGVWTTYQCGIRFAEKIEGARGTATTAQKVKASGQAPAPEEIHFARQLQDHLSFQQDGVQQLRHGIASFKPFLESILYHKNEDDRARQLSILREYLDSQKLKDVKDTERPFLGQLWQAWSYASQNNDERLVSSIASIFTSLLKTLSSLIDFRDHGSILCRTVLQNQHLRLIKRCLDAPKHKDFLLSPALRLLTEVVCFDGGVLAKEAYKRRKQTFDPATMRRTLGSPKPSKCIHQAEDCVSTHLTSPFSTSASILLTQSCLKLMNCSIRDEEDARRRPAIRTLTIRYILAHLKYLHEGGKADVLRNRPLCSSLFHFLRDDPAEVVNELLSATEQSFSKIANCLDPRRLLCFSNRISSVSLRSQHVLRKVMPRQNELPMAESRDHQPHVRCPARERMVSSWNDEIRPDQSTKDTVDLGLDSIDFYDRHERPNVRTLLCWHGYKHCGHSRISKNVS